MPCGRSVPRRPPPCAARPHVRSSRLQGRPSEDTGRTHLWRQNPSRAPPAAVTADDGQNRKQKKTIHIYRMLSSVNAWYSRVAPQTISLFATLFQPRDDAISVRHPLFKELGPIWIGMVHVHPTDGINRFIRLDPRPVSVCILFQRRRCTAGILCNQIHVNRNFLDRIHKAIECMCKLAPTMIPDRLVQPNRCTALTGRGRVCVVPGWTQMEGHDGGGTVTPWTMIGQFENLLQGVVSA